MRAQAGVPGMPAFQSAGVAEARVPAFQSAGVAEARVPAF